MGRVQSGLSPRSRFLQSGRLLWSLPDTVMVGIVIVLPLVLVVVRSFARVDPVTLGVEQVWTLDAYRAILSPQFQPVLIRSASLAFLTVLLCITVGTPAALAISRLRDPWRTAALAIVVLPSFVNFTVRIFAWQGLLATGGPVERALGVRWLYQPPAVALGMVTAYLPLYLLPVVVALDRTRPEVFEAAADLGATPWRTLWLVTVPLARAGIVTGVGVVGVLSLGEFVVPALLGGGRVMLVGSLLAERGAGRDQPVAGALTAVLLVTLGLGAVTLTAIRRRLRIGP